MNSLQKPKKTKKESTQAPKLTEDDYIEIGEKLADAHEFETEVTITTFRNKEYENFTGAIRGMDPNTKMISFDVGELDYIKISANIIVGIK